MVTLIGRLLGRSRKLRIYDPHIQLPGIYGSNREFILQAVPEIDRLIEDRLDDVLDWAECLVITQKLPAELADQVQSSGLRVVDLSGTWTAGDTSGGGRVALGHIEG